MKYHPLFYTLLIVTISACTFDVNPRLTTPPQPASSPTEYTSPITSILPSPGHLENETPWAQTPFPQTPEKLVEKARIDLAKRLFIPVNQIEMIAIREVTWPDASLGCAQSGTMYAQVLTPGFSVQFEAQGQLYEYHTDLDGNMILCDTVSEESSPGKDSDKNIDDGWPNENKDNDVIITTPIK